MWSFDWPVRRAVAVAAHGTYVIVGEGPQNWSAKFTRVDTEQYRRTARDVGPQICHYASMADAMHACQRHADGHSPESSGRLALSTPLP
jgi:hypothetical protein